MLLSRVERSKGAFGGVLTVLTHLGSPVRVLEAVRH